METAVPIPLKTHSITGENDLVTVFPGIAGYTKMALVIRNSGIEPLTAFRLSTRATDQTPWVLNLFTEEAFNTVGTLLRERNTNPYTLPEGETSTLLLDVTGHAGLRIEASSSGTELEVSGYLYR